MSDYQLRYRPASIRLLDDHLRLDPETIRIMREIEAQMTARQMVNLWLAPDWHTMVPTWQSMLTQPNLFPAQAQRPSATQYVPGVGPSTPRPGELSDVARAVYQLPVVQQLVLQAHDEGLRQLRLLRGDWDSATPGQRVAMVSITGLSGSARMQFPSGTAPDYEFSINFDVMEFVRSNR